MSDTATKDYALKGIHAVIGTPKDERLFAFADFMATKSGASREAYLSVRQDLRDIIASLGSEQRSMKAEARALKSEGLADSGAYQNLRESRLYNRPEITRWIAILRLAKAWSVHAKAGDPLLMEARKAFTLAAQKEAAEAARIQEEAAETHAAATKTLAEAQAESERLRRAYHEAVQALQVGVKSAKASGAQSRVWQAEAHAKRTREKAARLTLQTAQVQERQKGVCHDAS